MGMEVNEETAPKMEHRIPARRAKLENPASVDRLQSLVAGLAGVRQRELKPLLKTGVAIKPKTLLNPVMRDLEVPSRSQT